MKLENTLKNASTLNNIQCKNQTAVNFVKLKPNQKLQVFCKTEPKSVFVNCTPLTELLYAAKDILKP